MSKLVGQFYLMHVFFINNSCGENKKNMLNFLLSWTCSLTHVVCRHGGWLVGLKMKGTTTVASGAAAFQRERREVDGGKSYLVTRN